MAQLERSSFIEKLNELPDNDVKEQLGMLFALYERELMEHIQYLKSCLGDVCVLTDAATMRELSERALRESRYRFE